jgi:nitroreductase
MVPFALASQPITEIIPRRRSCRTYQASPITPEQQLQMKTFLASNQVGPLSSILQTGVKARFELVAAAPVEPRALADLGTYGTIKGVNAFILGTVLRGGKDMEDYGFLMEKAILYATAIGLDTCWLGGFFTRSTFARKMGMQKDECMPAVASIGYALEKDGYDLAFRTRVGGDNRFAWQQLFFKDGFVQALTPEEAGTAAQLLEMVRLAPSASNKQPWRIVWQNGAWHFYLRRTPGYAKGLAEIFLAGTDLQRVDMGIAMCHWMLTAQEAGIRGEWAVKDPGNNRPDDLTEYSISWVPA